MAVEADDLLRRKAHGCELTCMRDQTSYLSLASVLLYIEFIIVAVLGNGLL